MVKFHHFHENGWNLAKMALFREKGARGDPILSVTHAQTFADSDTVRVGDAARHGGEGGDPWGAARGVPPLRGACAGSGARREKQYPRWCCAAG